MGEICYRAMAILEIKSVEKFFGLLRVDFAQRLLHRKRRARVLCHSVGLNLGLDSIDGENFRRWFSRCGTDALVCVSRGSSLFCVGRQASRGSLRRAMA